MQFKSWSGDLLLKLFIRGVFLILFFWWFLLYLSFALNMDSFSLPLIDYVKAFLIGFLPNFGMLLSTTIFGKKHKKISMLILLMGLVFYITLFSLNLKIIILLLLVIIGSILSMINLFKN